MADRDRLTSLILEHWTRYRPSMLQELRRENRLEMALHETAEQMSDLFYELVSLKKMEPVQAWEIAIREMLLPEEPSPTSSPKSLPPVTSG
jgi:hypothetical protein